MPPPRDVSTGYGVLLLVGLALGFIVGIAIGQPSAGTVIGLGFGGLAAVVLRLRPGR